MHHPVLHTHTTRDVCFVCSSTTAASTAQHTRCCVCVVRVRVCVRFCASFWWSVSVCLRVYMCFCRVFPLSTIFDPSILVSLSSVTCFRSTDLVSCLLCFPPLLRALIPRLGHTISSAAAAAAAAVLVAVAIAVVDVDVSQGTESGATGARSAPVQFEADPAEADPFGLDAFLKDAKSSKKK